MRNVSFTFPLFQSVLLATVSVSVGGHAMRCVRIVAAVSVSPDESRGANLKMCGMAHNARVAGGVHESLPRLCGMAHVRSCMARI